MPSRLDGLMVKEVSGVDRPANRRTFLITKREDGAAESQTSAMRKAWEALSGIFTPLTKMDGDTDTPKTFDEAYAAAEAERQEWAKTEKLWPIWQALREASTAIILDDAIADPRADIAVCMQQALDAMAAQGLLDAAGVIKAMERWTAEPVEKADKTIMCRQKLLDKMKILIDEMMLVDETPAEKAITKEDSMADATPGAVAPVTKADFETLQKNLSDLTAANAQLLKAANDAENLAKAETDRRETAEMIAKAEKDMANVPSTTPVELGPLLKRAKNALIEADYNTLEKALVAASAAIKAGELLKEVGTTGANAGSNANDQLNSLAKAINIANPNLTKEQAFVKALDQNPNLYAQYQNEKVK